MERIHDLRFSADEGVSVASTIERHAGRGADEVGTTAIRRSLTRRDDCVDCSNWLRFRWRMSATSLFFFAWDQAEVGRPTIVITARPSSPSSFDSPPFRSSAISFGYSIRAIHLDGRTRRAPTPNFTVLSLPSTCTRHADNAWKWNKFQIKQLPLTWRRTEGKRGRGGGGGGPRRSKWIVRKRGGGSSFVFVLHSFSDSFLASLLDGPTLWHAKLHLPNHIHHFLCDYSCCISHFRRNHCWLPSRTLYELTAQENGEKRPAAC